MHTLYYHETKLTEKENITLKDSDEIHHLKNVLRLKKGNKVTVFDGLGTEALGEIKHIKENEVIIFIKNVKELECTANKIILACAIPKKNKFELIVEKCTELGVSEIIPIITKNSDVILSGERANKKLTRYKNIAISASKQSKRATIPTIHPICSFKDALSKLSKETTALIPSLEEKSNNILKILEKTKDIGKISLFIGPEGDFTKEEYSLASKSGCIPVSLGKNILRVETAAICTVSCASLYHQI